MVSLRRTAQPPTFTPAGYGLLSVAELATDDSDRHWRNGVQYQPPFCGTVLNTAAVCVTGTGAAKPSVGGLGVVGSDPFTVHAWLDCAPVGFTADEWRRQTTTALVNNEQAAVEAVFWTGLVAGGTVYPHLASNTTVADTNTGASVVQLQTAATIIVTGGPVDVVEGVGLLEGAIAGCYGGVPTLHVPRRAAAHLAANFLVERDGGRLRTLLGSYVAAGLGYPGTGPDGTVPAAGTAWLYATGQVKVWRSSVELTGVNPAEWIGRARNDQLLVAERTYTIGWDCCLFAVQVQLGGVISGTAGSAT